MRTLLSTRRARFYRLVRQANEQSSQWLEDVLKDKTRNNGHFTAVARLACLRILVCRDSVSYTHLTLPTSDLV